MKAARFIMQTRFGVVALALVTILPDTNLGQTLSNQKALGRYQQYVWQDQHGLPQNAVNAITRTRDGYLWFGTFEGAARFDGVRFSVFDGTNTPEFKSNQILALLEDRSGNLWMATNGGGLICRTGDSFKLYTTNEGLSTNFVRSLAEDRDGNLWIGTEGNGLNRFRDGRFDIYTTKDGLPGDYVHALVADPDGGMWIGAEKGLALFSDGRFTSYPSQDHLPVNNVNALCRDHVGALWVGTMAGRLFRFINGQFTDSGLSGMRGRVSAIYEDRDFGLWVGAEGGLAVLKDGRFLSYTMADGLPGDTLLSIYQDSEGDLWVGTEDSGVCQLRAGRFGVYTMQDGLPHDFARAVYEDSSGNLWVGTSGGFARLNGRSMTTYTVKEGLPENGGNAIAEDRAGNLWVSARGQLCRFRDNRFMVQPIENGQAFNNPVRVLLGDRAGNLWIGTRGSGLNLYRDGRFTLYTTRDGLSGNDIYSLYEDRGGRVWIGTLSGSVSCFIDGRFTNWTAADGLPDKFVNAFYEDRHGNLWLGTEGGGLCRFRDGKFKIITVRDGLYDNVAFQILSDTADDSGSLWMSCNRGVYRVALQELNDFAEDRRAAVTSYVYGVADGMLSRECNGGSPAGWKTRDGRLWFPTVKGAVAINPQQRDMRLPRVAIEGATIDRVIQSLTRSLELRPGQESLEIQYTALSWSRPQQVRFRYRMEGLDQNWTEAETRRTAYYSHLPPGNYTFRVIADNGEGVWDLEGKSLSITVLPPFYRTWWFTLLVGFTIVGFVVAAWKYRVSQLTRAQATQQAFSHQLIESQEAERKRIAAELHDSLGQTLLIIKNRAFLGTKVTENGDSATPQLERANEQFDEISGSATDAINEVRAIAYHLRPSQLERLGLSTSIQEMIDDVADTSGIRFDCNIATLDGVFSQASEINFYRIVQESLNNIVKHSRASEANVRILRDERGVELMIEDNGKGFDVNTVRRDGSLKSGLGLTSMAERARILGGKHQIESVPGRGTIVRVRIETTKG
jgi:ligand-binding sensor domain-containing protein/signal transduction histidine kinase